MPIYSDKAVGIGQDELNQLKQYFNEFFSRADLTGNPAAEAFRMFLGGTGPFANPNLGLGAADKLTGLLDQFRGQIPGMMNNFSLPPEIQDMLSSLGYGRDRITENLGARGQTPETQYLFDRFNDILTGKTDSAGYINDLAKRYLPSGGFTPGMTELQNFGRGIMSTGGFDDALNKLQQSGLNIISQGGRTADTQSAIRQFQNILTQGGWDQRTHDIYNQGLGIVNQAMSSGGMTAPLNALLNMVSGGVNARGFTPETSQLFNEAMKLIQSGGRGGALQPLDQILSLNRNQVATELAHQAEAARRSAFQRQGSAFAGGTTESALGEFADQALRAQSTGLTDTIQGQQKLQLQQLMAAMGLGSDVAKTANSALAAYLNLGGDIGRAASANLGSMLGAGTGLEQTAQQAALSRFGVGAQGLDAMIKNELARLQLGTSQVGSAQNAAIARLGIGNTAFTNAENMASDNRNNLLKLLQDLQSQQLVAGGQMRDISNLWSGREQYFLNALGQYNELGSGIFGKQQGLYLTQKQLELDNFLKSIGASYDISKGFSQDWLNAAGGLSNLTNIWSGLLGPAMGNQTQMTSSLMQALMTPSWGQQLLSSMLPALMGTAGGSIFKSIGDLLTGVKSSGGQTSPGTTPGIPGIGLPGPRP